MLRSIHSEVVRILQNFKQDLLYENVEYKLSSKRYRHMCRVRVCLRSRITDKKIIDVRLSIRNNNEIGDLESLLEECLRFAIGLRRSTSPEY